MTRPTREREEPGIAEVRRWRREVWEEAGGTLGGLLAYLKKREAARVAKTGPKRTKTRGEGNRKGRAA